MIFSTIIGSGGMDRVLLRCLVSTDNLFGIIRCNYSVVQLVWAEIAIALQKGEKESFLTLFAIARLC
jgi:hypothetical protein